MHFIIIFLIALSFDVISPAIETKLNLYDEVPFAVALSEGGTIDKVSAPTSDNQTSAASEQISSTSKTEDKKSAVEEFSNEIGSVRSLIVDFLLFILLIAFVTAGAWEFRRKSVVIDLIDVPKDLAEKGYTAQAVAQRIAAEIRVLQRAARIKGRLEEGVELSSSQIDFTVPSAGVSYRGIIRYVRQLLHKSEQRVQGEIVREAKSSRLIEDAIVPDAEAISIIMRTHDGYTTPSILSVTSDGDLPILLRNAAFEIASLVDPYLIATYWFREEEHDNSFEKTFEAVSRCFALTPADQHYRAYVIWGNALTVQRKFDEAERKYDAATRIKPRFASIYNGRGNLMRRKRRYDEAAAMYWKAIRLDFRDAIAWSNLGIVNNDRRFYRKAVLYCRLAIRLDPGNAAAWNGLGNALWKLGFHQDAETIFARAIDIDPGFGWSYLSWGRLLREQNRYDAAIAKVRIAAEQSSIPAQAYALWGDILVDAAKFDEAVEIYQRAIKADSSIVDSLAGLGRLLHQQHLYDEAVCKYMEAIQVDPYHTGARGGLADALRNAGRYHEAIEKYKELLSIDSYQPGAYAGWGQVLRNKHELEEAIWKFEQAIKIDPHEFWAWQSWGEALIDMHCYNDAISKFRKSVEVKPRNAYGYIGWGNALAQLGRLEEAVVQFKTAYELDNHNALAWHRWAETLIDLDRRNEVIEMIEDADAPWAHEPNVLIRAGHVLRRLGRTEEAIRMYEHALSIDPSGAGTLTGLADVQRASGHYKKSLELLLSAIKIDPWHAWARRSLGRVLYEMGRTDIGWRWYSCAHHRMPERVDILLDWADALISQAKKMQCESARDSARYHEEAEKKIQRAIEIDPWDTKPLRAMGNLLLKIGRPQDALNQFERALCLDPHDKLAQADKGKALRKLKPEAKATDAKE